MDLPSGVGWLLLCACLVLSKPTLRKDRVYHEPELSPRPAAEEDGSHKYDHEAFLGKEEATTFDLCQRVPFDMLWCHCHNTSCFTFFHVWPKFPEETEMDLLCVNVDQPPRHFLSVSNGACSVFSTPTSTPVFLPSLPFQPEDSRRDDSSLSSSDDSEKEEEFDRERQPCYYRRPMQTPRKKSSGFAAVSQLFSERWPGTPASRSIVSSTTERNIDFELDVRVEIDSGKCVLHPTTQQAEHDDVSLRRSCDRSLRSLDQESPPKKKKLQPTCTSSAHLLAGKKVPSSLQTKSCDSETTVFYIPGVDVKLHYNSKTLKTESPNASRGSSLPRTLSKESKLYAKGKGSGGVKTAKLYAWVALQTLPEEMVKPTLSLVEQGQLEGMLKATTDPQVPTELVSFQNPWVTSFHQ